ncbi:hypothetical protein J6590_020261 [Homalodisca vitripennis]|nr:hypothetical protein J6590_020261 [Homalodisca vitripennis]
MNVYSREDLPEAAAADTLATGQAVYVAVFVIRMPQATGLLVSDIHCPAYLMPHAFYPPSPAPRHLLLTNALLHLFKSGHCDRQSKYFL